MIDINSLPNISSLESIETDFKVFAGPGAGKTTWLTDHLQRVLLKSNRLNKTSKIACITYTNVAAEEILNMLNCDKNRFDISTIHSFLYRNIVKPFSYLIETDDLGNSLFNINKLNGHEEHIVHGDRLRRWIHTISEVNKKNYYIYNSKENKPKVIIELTSLDYIFKHGKIDLIIRQNRGARLPKSNNELWVYKSKYWSDGIMHHEDVLYFSYLILSKSPRVVEFMRAKFPYIFIDEFQDTTEVQTWIIEKITESQTKVGVVGDLAQSIYEFAGAKRSDFIDFKKEKSSGFKLEINHRSTKQIIEFLNHLRADIKQELSRNTLDGSPVKALIGNIQNARTWFEENYIDNHLHILTRKNTTVSEINTHLNVSKDNLIDELYSNDSNVQRAKLIHSILISFRFYQKSDFKNALNEIYKHLRRVSNFEPLRLDLRRISIDIINSLKLNDNRNKPIKEFYLKHRTRIEQIHNFTIGSNLNKGKANNFYEKYCINDLLPFVKIDAKSEDLVRTIHSAKGTGFNNVLVHFDELNDFEKYIINSTENIVSTTDDCRIYYVGCSRAKNNLFLNIPKINEDIRSELNKRNVDVIEL